MSGAYASNSFSKSSKETDFSAVQFFRRVRYVGASGEDALLEFWTGADEVPAPCLPLGCDQSKRLNWSWQNSFLDY